MVRETRLSSSRRSEVEFRKLELCCAKESQEKPPRRGASVARSASARLEELLAAVHTATQAGEATHAEEAESRTKARQEGNNRTVMISARFGALRGGDGLAHSTGSDHSLATAGHRQRCRGETHHCRCRQGGKKGGDTPEDGEKAEQRVLRGGKLKFGMGGASSDCPLSRNFGHH